MGCAFLHLAKENKKSVKSVFLIFIGNDYNGWYDLNHELCCIHIEYSHSKIW